MLLTMLFGPGGVLVVRGMGSGQCGGGCAPTRAAPLGGAQYYLEMGRGAAMLVGVPLVPPPVAPAHTPGDGWRVIEDDDHDGNNEDDASLS